MYSITVSPGTYPQLAAAFLAIALDQGATEPDLADCRVPRAWFDYIDAAERGLATLAGPRPPFGVVPLDDDWSEGDFCTFCFGEEEDMEALVTTDDRRAANAVLASYFEGWTLTPDAFDLPR